ncbi:MAG: hypothetical protein ACO3ZW_06370 [Opitutales bacterium]
MRNSIPHPSGLVKSVGEGDASGASGSGKLCCTEAHLSQNPCLYGAAWLGCVLQRVPVHYFINPVSAYE